MPAVACALVPELPLVAALRAEAALAGEPLAVVQGAHAGAPVVAASREALASGVFVGLTAAQARARCPELVLRPASEAAARSAHAALIDAALSLSPRVEDGGAGVVFLDGAGLSRVRGSAGELAAALRARTRAVGVPAQAGVASCKAVARLLAQHDRGAVPAEDERAFVAAFPLDAAGASPLVVATLHRWGVGTLGELARLPRTGLSDRLGPEGVRLHRLATGDLVEPLCSIVPAERVEEAVDLEYGAERLEPILFVVRAMLERVIERLAARGRACAALALSLSLAPSGRDERRIAPTAPTLDARSLLTLLRLELETRPPAAAVRGWVLAAEAARAAHHQRSLFGPVLPEPEKLSETLARLGALVGAARVGAPEVVDGWRGEGAGVGAFGRFEARADAGFSTRASAPASPSFSVSPPMNWEGGPCPKSIVPRRPDMLLASPLIARRIFRPALPAQVRTLGGRPAWIQTDAVNGMVHRAAGPTRVSAEWWERAAVVRDYYDVEIEREGVFRIYLEAGEGGWFLDAEYD